MIDLSFKRTNVVKNNPYHPELIGEVTWESSNCKIIEEFLGGVTSKNRYSIYIREEYIGKFHTDFAKSMANQIKTVILEKFPNETFSI